MVRTAVDHLLATLAFRALAKRRIGRSLSWPVSDVPTAAGRLRCIDTGGQGAVILITPDGPNVVEHYGALVAALSTQARVICFDMPGFGFSVPGAGYSHSLDQGAAAVLAVLDHFGVARATLAFSCANGFYALRVAQMAPARVAGLVLSQTPSLRAMHAWADRTVPRPLRIPVLGQLLNWLLRERAALGWYRKALPRGADAAPFQAVARTAFRCGACFSLAGVVQGLSKETHATFEAIAVPCVVLWGTQDRSHRTTDPRSLLSHLPHAEWIEMPGCGHFPDLEADAFAGLLAARARAWSA